jgi:cysteinyl-tRNA synthetase
VNDEIRKKTEQFPAALQNALNEDLNTAAAHGALFELVRDANTAIDSGTLGRDNVAPLLAAIKEWNLIFDVLPREATAEKAGANGRISAEQVESLLSAREEARKSRQFQRADEIRDELTGAGIIIEDAKSGSRWRYK